MSSTLETPWTVARQASPFMGFSRQEYWSGLPFPSPGSLPGPGIKRGSPVLLVKSLPTELPGKPYFIYSSLYVNPDVKWGPKEQRLVQKVSTMLRCVSDFPHSSLAGVGLGSQKTAASELQGSPGHAPLACTLQIRSCAGGGATWRLEPGLIQSRCLPAHCSVITFCLYFSCSRWAEEGSRGIRHRHGCARDRTSSGGHPVSVQKIPEEKGRVPVLAGESLPSLPGDTTYSHHPSRN